MRAASNGDRQTRVLARERPAWLPHPGLLAFILTLWVVATALQFGHLLPR